MKRTHLLFVLLVAAAGVSGCPSGGETSIRCFGDGVCQAPDGNLVDVDGNTICELTGTCGDREGGDSGGGGGGGDEGGDPAVQPPATCTQCTSSTTDTDGDCIPDSIESAGVNSDPSLRDTDGDGVPDGCEDRNLDGQLQTGEMDPSSTDTDGDGIPDGVEDANHNGRFDIGETHAVRDDTDFDGILDGIEDRDHDGVVDPWVDTNGDGCYTPGVDTAGESDPRSLDTDVDGVADDAEDVDLDGICDWDGPTACLTSRSGANCETCAFEDDTDCDGLADGKEDRNGNGVVNTGETNPLNADTDGDGLADGLEDRNGNGVWDSGAETDALRVDTDGDGLADGLEDANQNGMVDAWVDADGDNCYDDGETQGETDPRKTDSDGDGIGDGVEDTSRDGTCDTAPDGNGGTTFIETCGFLFDTDCDALHDGAEDVNRNGSREIGELDPMRTDTDMDGLIDGCPAWEPVFCEDTNNDGSVDTGETNPLLIDTDGDGLIDGCEVRFDGCTTQGCGTDPLMEDTDADGLNDGEEDSDHNCAYDDPPETDPRIYDPEGGKTPNELPWVEFQVCGSTHLKPLTFAASSRRTHDYKLALESEFDSAGDAVPYHVVPFGKDLNGGGFSVNDPEDALWGHAFQSPAAVYDAGLGQALNRDIYGFLLTTTTAAPETLNDIMNDVVAAVDAHPEIDVTNRLNELARPAHDDLPAFAVMRAQEQLELSVVVGSARTALRVRNEMLGRILAQFNSTALDTGTTCSNPSDCEAGESCGPSNICQMPAPENITEQDAVYPPANCPAIGPCYSSFTLHIAGVQRPQRSIAYSTRGQIVEDPAGQAEVILIVALTQNDKTVGAAEARKHDDRVTRLQDLTGGSALGRFDADVSKQCERKPQQQAAADMLWVVDDSRSMQQIIGRLQQAADDARAVLSANANIVDFRVAMTTTNASIGARTQCWTGCLDTCCNPTTGCSGASNTCEKLCADQNIGCMLVCPAGCGVSCADGWCDCTGCADATCTGTCLDPSAIGAGIAADSDYLDPATDPLPTGDPALHPLPGGGGTFYYEDSEYLDCLANAGEVDVQKQDFYFNACNPADARFTEFFGAGGTRKQLLGNAGFLGSCADEDVAAGKCTTSADVCAASPLSLLYDVDDPSPPAGCDSSCDRLTAACDDGPTVLASQMCDLIRTMGGLPCDISGGTTSGARPHSAPEHGSRSARRLLSKLLPALPSSYAGPMNPAHHLRINCDVAGSGRECPGGLDSECGLYEYCDGSNTCQPTGSCAQCNPGDVITSSARTCPNALDTECGNGERCQGTTCVADCAPVPVVTILLSDEEDSYFKDDCYIGSFGKPSASGADKRSLPAMCRWADDDHDPTTEEACTFDYCTSAENNFDLGWPTGFDADAMARTNGRTLSSAWPDVIPPECSPEPTNPPTSCVGDPCPAFYDTDAATCERSFTMQDGRTETLCSWDGVRTCRSVCKLHTPLDPTNDAQLAQQRSDCIADPMCQWIPGLVDEAGGGVSTRDACVPAYPMNDCQPCKRLMRTLAAVEGDAVYAGVEPNRGLVGLGSFGPVYAIARGAGQEGFAVTTVIGGSVLAEDDCRGGAVTWGRGDGEAYRDIAAATLGRTQDVCTNNVEGYRPFIQLLISDIITLSAPYPLLGAPISATIKVGIARPRTDGSGLYDFYEVPRSSTSGFIYDSTSNSIGFKSDPVDGQCGTATCSENGVIEDTEVAYARQAPHVPRENDSIFVSYRYWRPVPCRDECGDGQVCLRLACPDETDPSIDCPGGLDSECPALGQTCVSYSCVYECTPGDFLDICICGNCGTCDVCDEDTGRCELPDPPPDPCDCDPRAEVCEQLTTLAACESDSTRFCVWDPVTEACLLNHRCVPGGVQTCDPGFACDESCVCVRQPGCDVGVNPDGTVRDCAEALACCETWAEVAADCEQHAQAACDTDANCDWNTVLGTCEPVIQPCCLPGETADCFNDPETGEVYLNCVGHDDCACVGSACNVDTDCLETWQTCLKPCGDYSDETSCNGGVDCTWTDGACVGALPTCDTYKIEASCNAAIGCLWDSGTVPGTCQPGECAPVCHPVTEYCCISCGCTCATNPG